MKRWAWVILWLTALPLTIVGQSAGAADTLAVYLLNPEPAERSICELRFTLSKSLPPKASFRLRFPDGFDLRELLVVGSDRIDGGFRLHREGQEVIVARSGRGHAIPAGTEVDLKLANVRVPAEIVANLRVRMTVEAAGTATVDLEASVSRGRPAGRVER